MVIRISRFDFPRIEHLTWVGDFSPSVDFGASVDHYNVLRSCLLHLNVLREFNILSKSGLGIKIGQSCAEIATAMLHQFRVKFDLWVGNAVNEVSKNILNVIKNRRKNKTKENTHFTFNTQITNT